MKLPPMRIEPDDEAQVKTDNSKTLANALKRIEELEAMVKVFRACIETRQLPEQGSRCHKIVHELVGESD